MPQDTGVLEEGCCEMFCSADTSPEQCSLSRHAGTSAMYGILLPLQMQLPLVKDAEPVVWHPAKSTVFGGCFSSQPGSPVVSHSSLKEKDDGGVMLLIKFIASIVPYIWRILNYKYSPFISFLMLFLLYADTFRLAEIKGTDTMTFVKAVVHCRLEGLYFYLCS